MAKVIVSDQGRINDLLATIDEKDIINIAPHGDGKILVAVKGAFSPINLTQTEIIKEVQIEKIVDNPKNLAKIEELQKGLEDCAEMQAKSAEHIAELVDKLDIALADNDKLKKANEKALKEIAKLKKAVDALSTE